MTSANLQTSAKRRAAEKAAPASKLTLRTLLIAGVAAVALCVAAYIPFSGTLFQSSAAPQQLANIPFDGAQAYKYLQKLCDFGARYSGSRGMAEQQKYLIDYFEKLGAKVTKQEFNARHPLTGEAVPMMNIIVEWHPERKERVLLCAHYDTRPFPDRDRRNPRGIFIGANDGASGVALLMELGKSMPKFKSKYGVDFLLVDGEDFVFHDENSDRDMGNYCVGADHFGRKYVGEPPPHKYRNAVVFDMIAGTNVRFPKDLNSVSWPDSKPIVNEIWETAARLKVKEFLPTSGLRTVLDDHVMLHDVGRIPAIDIICEFPGNFIFWHTEGDTPDKCSPLSLAKVGWVIEEWLKSLK